MGEGLRVKKETITKCIASLYMPWYLTMWDVAMQIDIPAESGTLLDGERTGDWEKGLVKGWLRNAQM